MRGLKTDEARSTLMRRVKQRGTTAELAVAECCRNIGLRYRLNVQSLPGSPDLANKKDRWAIFVNGCFWHQHEGCRRATLPKANGEFWREKFAANRARDERKARDLGGLGFRVLVIWECEAACEDQLRRKVQMWAKRVS